jgi:hypothetical protein
VSAVPDSARGEEEQGAESEATSMRVQLSKEVATWAKERRQQSGETAVAPKQAVPERNSRRPTGASKKSKVSSLTGKPAVAPSRPFSMSYDGLTQAEYIQYLLDRGSR